MFGYLKKLALSVVPVQKEESAELVWSGMIEKSIEDWQIIIDS